MVDIQPFRGLRYNLELIKDLSLTISPPYDVISPEEQRLYYDKSPYNIVRLELGEDLPQDSAQNNRYTRAAAIFRDWLDKGILVKESRPALYVFQQCFSYQSMVKSRWGLTVRLRLEDWSSGKVRPHEVTFKQPTSDRLHLLRSCQVNLSPIWGILSCEEEGLLSFFPRLSQGKPLASVTDHYGVSHNMWVVTEKNLVKEVTDLCHTKVLYIADGHHRYETALLYQKEQQAACSSNTGKEAFNYVMITLMDAIDYGVVMLPTHRLVRLPEGHSLVKLREQLSSLFHWEELPRPSQSLFETVKHWLDNMQERGKEGTVLGLYGLSQEKLCLLYPKDRKALQETMSEERSLPWKELDVSLLHWVILRGLLRIEQRQREKEQLEYTQDGYEAIYRVDSGEFQLAFWLNPVPLSSVIAIADAGDRMPQKSTYFYPKLPTGLVMNPLWD